MSYRHLLPIFGLAAAMSCASPQYKFSNHVGIIYDQKEENKVKPKIDSESKNYDSNDNNFDYKDVKEILEHSVRIDAFMKVKERGSTRPGNRHSASSGFTLCDNYVLTASHNVPEKVYEGMEITKSVFVVNKRYLAKVTKRVPQPIDLALLKVDCDNCIKPYMGGFTSEIRRGDFIAGAGIPLGRQETLFTGRVVGQELIGKGSDIFRLYLNIDASISQGDSGAPVFNYYDGDSRFIGIVLALQPHFNGIASISPLEYVVAFLDGTPAIKCWDELAFRDRK